MLKGSGVRSTAPVHSLSGVPPFPSSRFFSGFIRNELVASRGHCPRTSRAGQDMSGSMALSGRLVLSQCSLSPEQVTHMACVMC